MKCRALWGIGLVLGLFQVGYGQAVPPPNPGSQGDVKNLAHQMAERVRHLGEDIESDLGQTPAARHLVQDATDWPKPSTSFTKPCTTGRTWPGPARPLPELMAPGIT